MEKSSLVLVLDSIKVLQSTDSVGRKDTLCCYATLQCKADVKSHFSSCQNQNLSHKRSRSDGALFTCFHQHLQCLMVIDMNKKNKSLNMFRLSLSILGEFWTTICLLLLVYYYFKVK